MQLSKKNSATLTINWKINFKKQKYRKRTFRKK